MSLVARIAPCSASAKPPTCVAQPATAPPRRQCSYSGVEGGSPPGGRLASSDQLPPQLLRQPEPLGGRERQALAQGAVAGLVKRPLLPAIEVLAHRLRHYEAAGPALAPGFGVQPGAQVGRQGDR